jgi:hypothetical protein
LSRSPLPPLPSGPRARGLGALAAYAAVFAVLALPWIRRADEAVPTGTFLVSTGDARLIIWALAWVTHALATDPTHLFDANINHPAPAQLTGSEHFLSSQLVFAPLYGLTGNALLAANLLALLSYPLGAFAMYRLLLALGCGGGPAWVGGLVLALGPLRVPGNLQVIQYLSFYLPLAALALTRLRGAPRTAPALALALVLTAGFFSAYYMAVMLSLAGLVWGAAEMIAAGRGRWRFAALAAGATALAGALLALVSRAYLGRLEAVGADPVDLMSQGARLFAVYQDIPGIQALIPLILPDPSAYRPDMLRDPAFMARVTLAIFRLAPLWYGAAPLVLAALGTAALAAPGEVPRRLARRGLVLALLGTVLMLGPMQFLGERRVYLPFVALGASPARFFRFPWRFAVLAGFGAALLAAAALEAARGLMAPRRHRALVAAAAVLVVLTRGASLVGGGFETVAGQSLPIYDVVREAAAAAGPGPLLELPIGDGAGRSFEWDAMVGSTRHWLPLVTGLTGYPPPHREFVVAAVRRLPETTALDALVAMTHLRWLLLRPRAEWTDASVRDGVLRLPGVTEVAARDGWTLARVDRTPRDAEPFAAIAAGTGPPAPR